MKKITNIHISSHSFYFEEDATKILEKYIEHIKQLYKDNGEELKVAEVETRIADICHSKAGEKGIVTASIIQEAINTIGIKIEEPRKEEETPASPQAPEPDETNEPWHKAMLLGNKLFRNKHNSYLGGVLSGLAAYYGASTGLLRLLTFLLFLVEPIGSIILIAYILLWIITPKATTIIDYTRMYRVSTTAGTEATKAGWKNNYDRCTQELMQPSGTGCLPTFVRALFFILVAIVATPFAILFFATIIFVTAFISMGCNFLSVTAPPAYLIASIGSIFFIGILLFAIMHWILKKLRKCKPMKIWARTIIIVLLLASMAVSLLSITHIIKTDGGLNHIENTIIQKVDNLKNLVKENLSSSRMSQGEYYCNNPLTTNEEGTTIGVIWSNELQKSHIPLTIESIHNDKGNCHIYFYTPSLAHSEEERKINNKEYSANYNITLPYKEPLDGSIYFMWDSCKNTIYIDEDYEFTGTRSSGIIRASTNEIDICYSHDSEGLSYGSAKEKGLIPFKITYYKTDRVPSLAVDELIIYPGSNTIVSQ